jgi:hypothetical protein
MENILNILIKVSILILTVIFSILLIFQLTYKFELFFEAKHFKDNSLDEGGFYIQCLYHKGAPHLIQLKGSNSYILYCQIGSDNFVQGLSPQTVNNATKVIK